MIRDEQLEKAADIDVAHPDENVMVRAELAELKAPPKVLSAEEVTEPGPYWWRLSDDKKWTAENVYLPGPGKRLIGQFIGPLTPPDV